MVQPRARSSTSSYFMRGTPRPPPAGGADRLLLSTDPEDGHYSPEPAVVSAVVRETDVPVWVVLRTREDPHRSTGRRLVNLGASFVELGARGLAFGFLDRDLEIDRASCAEMCTELGGVPWLFHGFDVALDVDRAWRDVIGLPGLESVVSAGSTRGLAHGADDLIARARARPARGRAGHGRWWPDPGPGAVAGQGGRTPVRDRILGSRGQLLDPRAGRRRPCPVVADARRRRALAGSGDPDRLTPAGHRGAPGGCCTGAGGSPQRS